MNRLGLEGPAEVKSHPWLRNFPWEKLYNKELEAPFIPNVIFTGVFCLVLCRRIYLISNRVWRIIRTLMMRIQSY